VTDGGSRQPPNSSKILSGTLARQLGLSDDDKSAGFHIEALHHATPAFKVGEPKVIAARRDVLEGDLLVVFYLLVILVLAAGANWSLTMVSPALLRNSRGLSSAATATAQPSKRAVEMSSNFDMWTSPSQRCS
jgi:hypothetical protein